MSSIILVMVLTLVLPLAVALLFNLFRTIQQESKGEALGVCIDCDAAAAHDYVVLEFNTGPNVKKTSVQRIILEREFAGRVLAQTPAGFRSRTPEPPPEYHSFEPDLDELHQRYKHVTSGMIAKEKRRQYDEVVEAWNDLRTSVVIWEGDLTVRRGQATRLVVPMRTDVAATGRFTFIYSYRRGLFTANATTGAEYRPRLVALHG